MIIDYEAFVGHFAFRPVPRSDVGGLVEQMDTEGIDLALVSPLEAVTYRNVQAANELLIERLDRSSGRLVGAAVANPAYPRAAEDARACLGHAGIKALRLMPSYHGYRLGEEVGAAGMRALMRVAADAAAPVSILYEIEDDRQRHPLFTPLAIDAAEVAAVIKAFPEVNFVLERAAGTDAAKVHRLAPQTNNWYVDISGRNMLGATIHQGIADVLALVGADRVLLGTGMAMQYPRAAFVKLQSLELDGNSLKQIQGGIAARLLGLNR